MEAAITKNASPKVTVLMSCYNRDQFLGDAIKSILNQSFTDFEFLIFDDASTDKTQRLLLFFQRIDPRIRVIYNPTNRGLTRNLISGVNLARGDYIARMDDDDISTPQRFEKQVSFMDSNREIAALGTFIEIHGSNDARSWVSETDPDVLEFLSAFLNPMCHPSVMLRTSFLRDNNLNYDFSAKCAQEYKLWHDILIAGGRIANLPEPLLKYRIHRKKVTNTATMKVVQRDVANKVKYSFLSKLNLEREYFDHAIRIMRSYCTRSCSAQDVLPVLDKIADQNNNGLQFAPSGYEKFRQGLIANASPRSLSTISKSISTIKNNENQSDPKFLDEASKHCKKTILTPLPGGCLSNTRMPVAFAFDENYSEPALVAVYSLLSNALPSTHYEVYILIDDTVTNETFLAFKRLFKQFKDHVLVAIDVGVIFEGFYEVRHITKATYYRLILHNILPETDFILYIDVDTVILKDLSHLYPDTSNAFKPYLLAVKSPTISDVIATHFKDDPTIYVNAGVIGMNLKAFRDDKLGPVFLKEAQKGYKVVDQDVLNIICKNRIQFLHPKYNCHTWVQNQAMENFYPSDTIIEALADPAIYHWNGNKPWTNYIKSDRAFLWWRYFLNLKQLINLATDLKPNLPPPSFGQLVNIDRISPAFENFFFGYYDLAATNPDGDHLALSVPILDRLPTPSDKAILTLLKSDGSISQIGSTNTWNFQQGAFLQFRPSHTNQIIYNFFDEATSSYQSKIYDLESGKSWSLPLPVANVSPCGKKALSLNFSRLYDYRPGYGYTNKKDAFFSDNRSNKDGVFLLDLDTGEFSLILSYRKLWKTFVQGTELENQKLIVNHVAFNTDTTRFLMLFRFFSKTAPWPTLTITSDLNGDSLRRIFYFGSHYHWKDPNIFAVSGANETSKVPSQLITLYEVNDTTGNYNPIDIEFFAGDGHCSYSPCKRYMLYDSYNTASFPYRRLQVYDLKLKKGKTLAYLYSDPKLHGGLSDCRCDLHPRWSRCGNYITIDSTHEGYRGIYKIRMAEVLLLFDNNTGYLPETHARLQYERYQKSISSNSQRDSNPQNINRSIPKPKRLRSKDVKSCVVHANQESFLNALEKNGVFLEIDVHFGDTTRKLFTQLSPHKVYVVDLFNTHKFKKIWKQNAPKDYLNRTDLDLFISRFKPEIQAGKLKVLQGSMDETHQFLNNNSLNAIIINTEGTYEMIQKSVNLALPKLKPDGFLLFSKYSIFNYRSGRFSGVVQAVNELCIEEGFILSHLLLDPFGFHNVALKRSNLP